MMASACKKDEGAAPPPPLPAENPLRQLFADHVEQATQHFTVNTDNGPAQITGAAGVHVAFAQHAFRKADGTVATGTVEVALVEALRVGDMLWLNKQTVGLENGVPKMLVSGGQFRLTAEQNGEPLVLAQGASFISVPTVNPDPAMTVFSGMVQDDGTLLWDPWPINPIDSSAADSSGSGGGGFSYDFPNDSLGWINCDYFYSYPPPLTSLQVTCEPQYDHLNTLVWVIFPEINSMASLTNGEDNQFGTYPGYEVPVGMNITVVALAQVDGAYLSCFINTVATAGMNLPVTLVPTTLEEFQLEAGQL